jgi:hypothetical protein
MPEYSFAIPSTKQSAANWIGVILVIINTVLFIYLAIYLQSYYQGIALFGAGLNGLFLAYHFRSGAKSSTYRRYLLIIMIISGMLWALYGKYAQALLCAGFGIAAYLFLAERKIAVTEEKILITGFPAREIDWKEVDQAIIKDGLFTLILTDNSTWQVDAPGDISTTTFNNWAGGKIASGGSNTTANQ